MNSARSFAVPTFSFLLAAALCSPSFGQTKQDNTEVNKRDQSAGALTADQQGMGENDTEITRRIRQDLMKDKSLSTYAHNIKIISVKGKVTLKGPVRSQSEQDKVLKYARSVAGMSNVNSEIAIAKSN